MSDEKTKRPIDWTKPLEHFTGIPARFLGELNILFPRKFVCAVGEPGQEATIVQVDAHGCWDPSDEPIVRNLPERRVLCVININIGGHCSWPTREIADEEAHPSRKAIITVYECDGKYETEVEHV